MYKEDFHQFSLKFRGNTNFVLGILTLLMIKVDIEVGTNNFIYNSALGVESLGRKYFSAHLIDKKELYKA